MSSLAFATPSGDARSIVTLFLLRLNEEKNPAPVLFRYLVGSPLPSGSTLMTSAPRSASTSSAVGPITMWQNSTTRMPSSGRVRFTPRLCGNDELQVVDEP